MRALLRSAMGSLTIRANSEAGSTSPLWAILTAPAHWLSFTGSDATTLAIKLIGVLLGLACVWIVQRIACGLLRSRFAGCCAAVLFAVDPRLLFGNGDVPDRCADSGCVPGAIVEQAAPVPDQSGFGSDRSPRGSLAASARPLRLGHLSSPPAPVASYRACEPDFRDTDGTLVLFLSLRHALSVFL